MTRDQGIKSVCATPSLGQAKIMRQNVASPAVAHKRPLARLPGLVCRVSPRGEWTGWHSRPARLPARRPWELGGHGREPSGVWQPPPQRIPTRRRALQPDVFAHVNEMKPGALATSGGFHVCRPARNPSNPRFPCRFPFPECPCWPRGRCAVVVR